MYLTPEQILALKPGTDLDYLVAKALGWEYQQNAPEGHDCYSVGNDKGWWKNPDTGHWLCARCQGVPEYSTDISAAFPLLSEVKPSLFITPLGNDKWMCGKANHIYNIKLRDDHDADKGLVIANSAPEAICKMRLLLKMGVDI